MNCTICWKETNAQIVFDVDIQPIPLCDDTDCYIKLLISLEEKTPLL